MLDYELVFIITSPIYIYSIFKLLTTFFIRDDRNNKLEFAYYLAYSIISSTLIFITKIPIIVMFINLIGIYLLSLNYIESLWRRFINVIYIYSIGIVIEVLVLGIMGFYGSSIFKNSEFNSVIGLFLVRTATLIGTYLINKHHSVNNTFVKIPIFYYLSILIILFGTLYLYIYSLNSPDLNIYRVCISGTILIVVNVTLMFIDEKIYKSIIISAEKHILQEQSEAYKNQIQLYDNSNNLIKSIRHDMKNHIVILDALFTNGSYDDFKEYILKLNVELSNQSIVNSNNYIIDSILNFKLEKAIEYDINLKLDINVPPKINISDYDITIILGNLLDNALMGCVNSYNKYLLISINQSLNNSLVIFIDNSYDGKVVFKDGKYITTKKSKLNHGLGIENIKKSVNKYGGEINIKNFDNMFSVSIILPYEVNN